MNEAEARAEQIAVAGWGVAIGSGIRREYAITLGQREGLARRVSGLSAD